MCFPGASRGPSSQSQLLVTSADSYAVHAAPVCSHMRHSNVWAHIKKPKQWQPCPCLDAQKYSALQVGLPRKTECSCPNGRGTENSHMYTQFVFQKTDVLLPCNPLCAACEDKSGSCAGYTKRICAGQCIAWATDSCAKANTTT